MSDTKQQIFNTALRMFAANGYENVSIRDIADAVGIKTASIYYHYKSKQEILDGVYDFYEQNRYVSRPDKEQYEPIIRDGTKEDIVRILKYSFPPDIVRNMVLSLLVIFTRMYTDSRAKELYSSEMTNSLEYLTGFFETGIQLGRFSLFNVKSAAVIFMSVRMFAAQSVTVSPEQIAEWNKTENEVFERLISIIPFVY